MRSTTFQVSVVVSGVFDLPLSQRKEFYVAIMLPASCCCDSHSLVSVVHGGLLFVASISVACLCVCTTPLGRALNAVLSPQPNFY